MGEPLKVLRPIGVAERNARMDQLRTQLSGISLTGQLRAVGYDSSAVGEPMS